MSTNTVFNSGGPAKLFDFGNADVGDDAGVCDKVLKVNQEVEEAMNIDVKDA
jgi:hypothetical protein